MNRKDILLKKNILVIIVFPLIIFAAVIFTFPAGVFSSPGTGENAVRTGSQDAAEAGELRDIKNLMDYEFAKKSRAAFIAALAAAALFAAFLWLRARGKNLEEIIEDTQPPVPPEVTAMAALDVLDASGLIENGHFKEYYTRLSHIVRVYLGGALRFNCVDLYCDEAASRLSELGVARKHIASFEAISNECDLVKFAKFKPSEDDARSLRGSAGDFIKHTSGAGFR
jgi:hypothetical protein